MWVSRIGRLKSLIETCSAHNVERTTLILEIQKITPNITLHSIIFLYRKQRLKIKPHLKSDMDSHFQIYNHNLDTIASNLNLLKILAGRNVKKTTLHSKHQNKIFYI